MLERGHRSILALTVLTGLILSQGIELRGQVIPEPPFTYEFIVLDLWSMHLQGLDYANAAWGDQDLDGDLDLLVTGLTDEGPLTGVYMNVSEEEFVVGEIVPRIRWRHHYEARFGGITPLWLGDIAWIDFNNDGLLEFVISGTAVEERPSIPQTQIYAPAGTEYVPVSGIDLIGVTGGSIDWGDYDNDGDPDLLLTGQRSGEVVSRIYDNEDGTLLESDVALPFTSLGESKFGDFDADGDLDIILTAVYTPTGLATRLLRNDGGAFVDMETDFPGLGFASVDWGDYDNDGDLDLLLSGGELSPLVVEELTRVFRNDGEGAFTDIEALVDNAVFGTARWGDYDNDGLLDIVIAGGKGITGPGPTKLYRNEGEDGFVPAINLAGVRAGQLGFGDYDADGDLDVVVAGSDRLVQYRNDHRRVNNPPSPPTNLRTTKSTGAVTLAWDAADDVETASPGLTYNIRMGSKPMSLDVLSPMSDVHSGRRLVADMGNVQNNTSWTIDDLRPGTYYWSVQAIDHSFSGSAWAEEASFEISATDKTLVDSESDALPRDLALARAYPNPFDPRRGATTLEFEIDAAQDLRIEVYTALGAHVATLVEGYLGPGRHLVRWDGRSSRGAVLGAGVYFVRIAGERVSETIQLVRTGS